MPEHRRDTPGTSRAPVPRDMPDQQARPDEDPWEAAETGTRRADGPGTTAGQGDRAGPVPDESLPDTDEAGTGRRGAPRAATVNPEHPVPDESPG